MQKALDEMHRDVKQRSNARRDAEVQRHNSKTNIRPINFTTGDYVLKGTLKRERGKKPGLKWRGPFRVLECQSDYIFTIEDLLSGAKSEVHGRRLKFFRNRDFSVTEEVVNHLAYQQNELLVVKDFEDIRRTGDTIEVYTSWRGFDTDENSWVDISIMMEDVPDMIKEYVQDTSKHGTPRQRNIAKHVMLSF